MKVLSVSLKNFASYESLEFDFTGQGLTLISGPTGAGKSTLCDAIPWVLFGRTAKDGAVDEVLSWPGDLITSGHIVLENGLTVTRIRGYKVNDLYFNENTRGKDLQDTQKLINQTLGVTSETYLAGAYLHEFSQTAQFFTATAKIRRSICEQIVDLSLAKKLQVSIVDTTKSQRMAVATIETAHSKAQLQFQYLSASYETELENVKNWKVIRVNKNKQLEAKYHEFELKREANIKRLATAYDKDLKDKAKSTTCSECGASKTPAINPTSHYKDHLDREKLVENPYLIALMNIEEVPSDNLDKIGEQLVKAGAAVDSLEIELNDKKQTLSDMELLAEVLADFRSYLVKNTIITVENTTNKLLSDYFDSEIQVEFEVEDADKLEVTIHKDGNTASYTQLSKGQRGILKLCFGVAVMEAIANQHGLHFDQMFFDESLDGLDDNMKMKAVRMLEGLALNRDGVFFVEHSATIKASVDNQYQVTLFNGNSKIEKS